MAYLENQLNRYDMYNYRIQLYQVDPSALIDIERALTPDKSVLLIDSATGSQYNISKLEHTFVAGYGQVRQTFAHRFDFSISEPNGATFLSNLAVSAATLGIENHLQAMYIIVISFVGHAEGRMSTLPSKFYYPVTITAVDMQIDAGGSIYTVNAVENSTNAFNYLEGVVKEQITVEAATVGEFISEMVSKINRSNELQVLTNRNQAYPDEYVLEFDIESGTDKWAEWKIEQTDDEMQVNGTSRIGDKIQFVVTNGSNIQDIIKMALNATAEYKKIQLHNGGTARPEAAAPSDTDLSKLKVFFKLVPSVEYLKYDPLRHNYTRRIKYKIKKYIVPDLVVDNVEYDVSITDPTIQNQRVVNLIKEGLLRKRYDYIFTGKNTEVINLDIKLNSSFYIVGVTGLHSTVSDANASQPSSGNDAPNVQSQFKNLAEIQKQLEKISGELAEETRRAVQLIKTYKNTQGSVDPLEPVTTDWQELTSGAAAEISESQGRIQSLRSERDQLLAERQEVIAQRKAAARSLTKPGTYESSRANKIDMPVYFAADVVDQSDWYAPENDRSGGSLQFGAVSANLENTGDLMKIEIAVRGDPYWMGRPNSFYRTNTNVDDLVDYERGGNLFFLNIRLPIDVDDEGIHKPRSDFSITGLYSVISVVNSFSNGQFVQYISAVRDIATNASTVYKTLDNPPDVSKTSSASLDNANPSDESNDPAAAQEELSTDQFDNQNDFDQTDQQDITQVSTIQEPAEEPAEETYTPQESPAGWEPAENQTKWLGSANQQDPYIMSRMPGPKPPVSHFKDPADQAIARRMGFPSS